MPLPEVPEVPDVPELPDEPAGTQVVLLEVPGVVPEVLALEEDPRTIPGGHSLLPPEAPLELAAPPEVPEVPEVPVSEVPDVPEVPDVSELPLVPPVLPVPDPEEPVIPVPEPLVPLVPLVPLMPEVPLPSVALPLEPLAPVPPVLLPPLDPLIPLGPLMSDVPAGVLELEEPDAPVPLLVLLPLPMVPELVPEVLGLEVWATARPAAVINATIKAAEDVFMFPPLKRDEARPVARCMPIRPYRMSAGPGCMKAGPPAWRRPEYIQKSGSFYRRGTACRQLLCSFIMTGGVR